ncbi:ACT domain-containing protein, partial [Saccharothrix sp. ST-888]|uniref:ACT domain-containing protein n=1 Tax=Saccharothrix sp. ST-888 TaxID=1427391 RepID=UPI0005EC60F1
MASGTSGQPDTKPSRNPGRRPDPTAPDATRANPGRYVYCTLPARVPAGLRPVVTVSEPEGPTVVVPQEEADALGLRYEFVAAW